MEVEQPKFLPSPMTFDEASMERSKSFVKALQELKNLRPQLYSAADYCEKSFLHSEQKQVVLDNLKEYAVRALVNAVDHLGTVAYKLTDLVEQQVSDVSTMEVKVSCIDQKLLTCQTYMDKEGLRQQQLLAIIPRHHKRYILPNSANKKVHFSHSAQTDSRQMHVQARPRVHPSDSPGSKTLSMHLASDTKAPIKGPQKTVFSSDALKASPRSNTVFHLLDNEDSLSGKSLQLHSQWQSGNPAGAAIQSYGSTNRDTVMDSKPRTPFRSSDNSRQAVIKAPVRHKSMLSAFFVRQKTAKLRSGTVS